jgi:putative ABC transport system permease protein
MVLAVRTDRDALNYASSVRQQVSALDRDLAVSNVASMEEVFSDSVAARRFSTVLLGLFAGLGLLLAAVGLYGILSYSVAQRTREIGIRMALGAARTDVLSLVAGQGLRLALVGIAVGIVAAFALTRLMSSLLFEVSSTDPATFAAVPLLLFSVALLACYIPARRATKVDPIVSLRYE